MSASCADLGLAIAVRQVSISTPPPLFDHPGAATAGARVIRGGWPWGFFGNFGKSTMTEPETQDVIAAPAEGPAHEQFMMGCGDRRPAPEIDPSANEAPVEPPEAA